MSPQQTIARLQQAVAECDRYIAKESPRAPELRPVEIQALLAYYIAHRATLQLQINALENPTLETWAVTITRPNGTQTTCNLYSPSLQEITDHLPLGDENGSTAGLQALLRTTGLEAVHTNTQRIVRGPGYLSFVVHVTQATGLPISLHIMIERDCEKVL